MRLIDTRYSIKGRAQDTVLASYSGIEVKTGNDAGASDSPDGDDDVKRYPEG